MLAMTTPKVILIKLSDMAGRVVRIGGNKRPYWYRIERVGSPWAPENVGHRVWVWGTPLLASGRPAKRVQPCDFIGILNVIDVRP